MLKRIFSFGLIAVTAVSLVGCDENFDVTAGNPPAPESAKSADWNAYRNCRERLQYAKDMGEIDAARLADRVRTECENGFTPEPRDAGGPAITNSAGTR